MGATTRKFSGTDLLTSAATLNVAFCLPRKRRVTFVQPNGRYDASRGGDVSWLHWVVDNEPINFSQLKDRYYTPRLLARLLGVNKEPLGKVNDFTGRKLPPAVQLKVADARTKKLARR